MYMGLVDIYFEHKTETTGTATVYIHTENYTKKSVYCVYEWYKLNKPHALNNFKLEVVYKEGTYLEKHRVKIYKFVFAYYAVRKGVCSLNYSQSKL
jgi:hypothetical protein